MQNEIYQYVMRRRGRTTKRIGVIAARNDNGIIRIGWSQCNEDAGDVFDAENGLAWARSRMICPETIPPHMAREVEAMKERAVRYFKGARPEWIQSDNGNRMANGATPVNGSYIGTQGQLFDISTNEGLVGAINFVVGRLFGR